MAFSVAFVDLALLGLAWENYLTPPPPKLLLFSHWGERERVPALLMSIYITCMYVHVHTDVRTYMEIHVHSTLA